MFKKITALFAAVLMVLSLAACSGDTTRFNKSTALSSTPVDKIIDGAVAQKYTMTEILTHDEKAYKTFEYEDKQVIARIEKSGNVRVLFEYPLDTEIKYDLEASKRSGKHIYFTKKDAGAAYASLCAIYLPSSTQVTIVDTPCSNMVLLDTKKDSDLYNCGIIATASQISVIDLALGSVSTYSKTMEEIHTFINPGDAFFAERDFGAYTETTVEAVDEDHVMINIIEKNKKGETKSEVNFTFNPSNGVASF